MVICEVTKVIKDQDGYCKVTSCLPTVVSGTFPGFPPSFGDRCKDTAPPGCLQAEDAA